MRQAESSLLAPQAANLRSVRALQSRAAANANYVSRQYARQLRSSQRALAYRRSQLARLSRSWARRITPDADDLARLFPRWRLPTLGEIEDYQESQRDRLAALTQARARMARVSSALLQAQRNRARAMQQMQARLRQMNYQRFQRAAAAYRSRPRPVFRPPYFPLRRR